MASATLKVKKIRGRKETSSGARRKREIRRDLRLKLVEVAKAIGLDVPGQLDAAPSK
jgi:hypothetical protein